MRAAGTMKTIPVLTSPQGPLVEIEGRGEVLCLCSNDYLGLANHPEVVAAGVEGLERYGAGTASVRFICGKFEPHVELERDARRASAAPRRRSPTSRAGTRTRRCSTRSATEPTAIFSDALNHASIIDGMRLARPAHKVIYAHSDIDDLRRRARRGARRSSARLIVTDGVFCMEGDLAPLPELAEVAREHDATLIVDDSHGIGVVGETRPRGARALRPARPPEIVISPARSARRSAARPAGSSPAARRSATCSRSARARSSSRTPCRRPSPAARGAPSSCCASSPSSSRGCARTPR